jgi:hypothetical protein
MGDLFQAAGLVACCRREESTMYECGTRQRCGSGAAGAAPPITRSTEAWGWQLLARCRGEDPSMFFYGDRERGPTRERREHKAKQLCVQCPVRIECLLHSLRFQEPYGIWGGVAERERRRILAPTIATARQEKQMTDPPGASG